MIISQLNGGLGNQFFEYAMARALALRTGQDLRIDISRTILTPDRRFGLRPFNIKAKMAAPADILMFSLPLPRIRDTSLSILGWRIIKEKGATFTPVDVNPGQKTYVKGYWQSYKYFQDYEKEIRTELRHKTAAIGKNAEILKLISNSDSVCLHVRRGDYVTTTSGQKTHGTCALAYYESAIREITKSVSRPHFFVFSDDPRWTKENLKIGFPVTFITNNSTQNVHEDLRLMAACRHFITANSSLSWWGAWLGAGPNKVVVAPQNWYVDKSIDDRDLIPPSWTRI